MAEFERSAAAVWNGNSRNGQGRISSGSGALQDVPYTWHMRFGDAPGTNPEELVAAAHAACFSMALASDLTRAGYPPERIETGATCTIVSLPQGGWQITHMRLQTRASVPGIDEATFLKTAQGAKEGCPVSKALRGGMEIELEAALA